MKYLVLAYGDRSKMGALTKEQGAALMESIARHDEELKRSGHLLRAESLEWETVSMRPPAKAGGKTVTTDGPFLETKEQIGGVITIEARDLNEAVRVAGLHPAAHLGEELGCGVEVRPIEDSLAGAAPPAGSKRYLLLAYGRREPMEALSPDAMGALMARCEGQDAKMKATGKLVEGMCLTWDAMTIRPRGGKPVITDGPFLETKELVGGVCILSGADLQDAMRVAALHPAALFGAEVGWALDLRPFAAGCHLG